MTKYRDGALTTSAVCGIGTAVLMQTGIGYICEKILNRSRTFPGLAVRILATMVMTYAGAYASTAAGFMVANSVLDAYEVDEEPEDVEDDASE